MPGRLLRVGVDSAVWPIRSRIGDNAALTRPWKMLLMASEMQAVMSKTPQSEPPPLPPPPLFDGWPVPGGWFVGCGMQSSPVQGAVVVGVPVLPGDGVLVCVGRSHTGRGVLGAQVPTVGNGNGTGAVGEGVGG